MKYCEIVSEGVEKPPKFRGWSTHDGRKIGAPIIYTKDYDEFVSGHLALFDNNMVDLDIEESQVIVKSITRNWKSFKDIKALLKSVDAMAKPYL